MKIAYTTFCRTEDQPLLQVSNESLFNVLGENITRYVIDEESSRVSTDKDCKVLTREFPRGDTLDGIDCAIGMIQTFQQIVKESGCDYVFKIDADVIVTDCRFLKILEHGKFLHYGRGIDLEMTFGDSGESMTIPYCQGMAYAINRKAIEFFPEDSSSLRVMIEQADKDAMRALSSPRTNGYSYGEDETISRLMRHTFRNPALFGWMPQNAPCGHLAQWDYAQHQERYDSAVFDRLRVFDFVEFGKTSELETARFPEWKDRRAVVITNMAQAVSQLTGVA